MKAKEYDLLRECIEDGIRLGYQRAYKHTDKPALEDVWDMQSREVMMQIDEWFTFPEEGREFQ